MKPEPNFAGLLPLGSSPLVAACELLSRRMRGAIESSPLEKISGLDFVPVFTIGYQSAIAIPDLTAARSVPRVLSKRIAMRNCSDCAARRAERLFVSRVRLREACRRLEWETHGHIGITREGPFNR